METLAHLELEVIAQTSDDSQEPDPKAYQDDYNAIAEMAAETIDYEDDD